MTTLFKHVLTGMIENNEMHDGEFKDWTDADHAIETYADTFSGECEAPEREETIKALTAIIESNGADLQKAVSGWNIAVWGQDFSDNNGSVALDG